MTQLPCAIPGCPALGEPVLCAVHRKYIKALAAPQMPRCGRCYKKIEPGEWYEPHEYGLSLHLKPCRPPKGKDHDQSRARAEFRRDRESGAA